MQTVAWREVRSAARRPATYWTRAAAAAIGGAVLLMMMMQVGLGIISGRTLFMTCVWIAFLLCLLEGVRQAATSIVEERVEGTLGLLLLTRVRGAELLLGKFVALAFFALQTLMAVAPVVTMSLLVGGVSAGEVMRAALALANTLVVTLTVGLLISARSREPARAMFATFFVLGGGAFLLMLSIWPVTGWPGFIFNSLNPFTPFRVFDDPTYARFQAEFWWSILASIVISSAALWFVSRGLARHFAIEDATPKAVSNQPQSEVAFATVEKIAAPRASWFAGNPFEWLALRNLRLDRTAALPIVLAFVVAFLMVVTSYYGFLISILAFLVFGFLYSAGAAMTLARARQSGELELWLTTPITVNEIIKGQLRALRRAFVYPGLVLLLAWCGMFYFNVIAPMMSQVYSVSVSSSGGTPTPVTSYWPIFYMLGTTILSMVGLIFAVPYVGMWIALKVKSPAQATMRTFLLMFIAPWVIIGVPKVVIFVPVAIVANHSVRKLLKEYGARGLSAMR